MKATYLVRHDETKNMHRFYQVLLAPGIFNNWALVKEWGRVGSPGTVRKEWFDSEGEAVNALDRIVRSKQKKGYCFFWGYSNSTKLNRQINHNDL